MLLEKLKLAQILNSNDNNLKTFDAIGNWCLSSHKQRSSPGSRCVFTPVTDISYSITHKISLDFSLFASPPFLTGKDASI